MPCLGTEQAPQGCGMALNCWMSMSIRTPLSDTGFGFWFCVEPWVELTDPCVTFPLRFYVVLYGSVILCWYTCSSKTTCSGFGLLVCTTEVNWAGEEDSSCYHFSLLMSEEGRDHLFTSHPSPLSAIPQHPFGRQTEIIRGWWEICGRNGCLSQRKAQSLIHGYVLWEYSPLSRNFWLSFSRNLFPF